MSRLGDELAATNLFLLAFAVAATVSAVLWVWLTRHERQAGEAEQLIDEIERYLQETRQP